MSYKREPFTFDAGPLGHLQGLTISNKGTPAVYYFGGLSYAAPPTGQWRFRSPRKLPTGYQYGTASSPGDFTGDTSICPQPPSSNTPSSLAVSEDCLQLNVWTPAGPSPEDGWPVCFYIHGGFLQVGTANTEPEDLIPLLSDSAFRAIIVMPSYRLNVFGFLASTELTKEAKDMGQPAGNMGLWDQREALEWTHKNIPFFGGNPSNITVAGYSAGAYSAFQQLAHELFRESPERAIIKRVAMFSNSPGVKPKTLQDQQEQFDELLTKLGIALDLPAKAKLSELREISYQKLVEIQSEMKITEFRALVDDEFYANDLIDNINNGEFSKEMKERGITLLNGECEEEHTMYRRWRTPKDSYDAVYQRFYAEYGADATKTIMSRCCGSTKELPTGYTNWIDFFGRTYAHIQVHYLERGFHNALFEGGLVPGKDVLRYRFERRPECVAEKIPSEWGVTHLTDIPVWLWGCGYKEGLSDKEKGWLEGWNRGFARFVNGQSVDWGTQNVRDVRRWRGDGETDIWEDKLWDEGVAFWKMVN